MTDHFSVIGFNAGSAEELAEMVRKLPDTGAYSQPCGPGYYYRWQSDSGSELWVHLANKATRPMRSSASSVSRHSSMARDVYRYAS